MKRSPAATLIVFIAGAAVSGFLAACTSGDGRAAAADGAADVRGDGSGGTGGGGGGGGGGATDASCPPGQVWCSGCAPGTGQCGAACTGVFCPPDAADAPSDDAPSADAANARCADVTSQAACDARADCHPVFVDPATCGCAAAGCCARFDRCADGARATCSGPIVCTLPTPFCEGPHVVGYRAGCFEGCVRSTDCAL